MTIHEELLALADDLRDLEDAEIGDMLLSRVADALDRLAAASPGDKVREWQPIETAPHNTRLLLGWRDWRDDTWCMEIGAASTGQRLDNGYSNVSCHGSATHWMMPPPSPNDAALAPAAVGDAVTEDELERALTEIDATHWPKIARGLLSKFNIVKKPAIPTPPSADVIARAICCPDGCTAEKNALKVGFDDCFVDRDTFERSYAGKSTKIIMSIIQSAGTKSDGACLSALPSGECEPSVKQAYAPSDTMYGDYTPVTVHGSSHPSDPAHKPAAYRWRYNDKKIWKLCKDRPDHADDSDVLCEPLYTRPLIEGRK